MTDEKVTNEGAQPEIFKKGYQPIVPATAPTETPRPLGGYQPTQGSGTSPTNVPSPPAEE